MADTENVLFMRYLEKDEQILLAPFNHILNAGSKNVRSKLCEAFNLWLQIPEEKLKIIQNSIEIFHNSSLFDYRIDDIEDDSSLRRGVPTSHLIYSKALTINSAHYAFALGIGMLSTVHPNASDLCFNTSLTLHRGQGMDIYWRDCHVCPTEDEYTLMIQRKTGSLFVLGVKLMQLLSEDKQDYTRLLELLGLYFQINDDYINLISIDYHNKKTYCEDLTEGKFSFPIIHAIHKEGPGSKVFSIISKKPTDVEVKKYCVKLLDELGSLEYTRQKLCTLTEELKEEVDKLGNNPILTDLINIFFSLKGGLNDALKSLTVQ